VERWIITFIEHCRLVQRQFDNLLDCEDFAVALSERGITVSMWREVVA
jgi:hypothetical protein